MNLIIKANNLSLNTRHDSEKILKDGRGKATVEEAMRTFFPKVCSHSRLFVHEQAEITYGSLMVQLSNTSLGQKEKNVVLSEPMGKVFWILNYLKNKFM